MKILGVLRACAFAVLVSMTGFVFADEVSTVNVNSADAETLAEVLVGVGMSRANAIVEYRKMHGDFTDVADIANVKGIGLSTVARNQERIVLAE